MNLPYKFKILHFGIEVSPQNVLNFQVYQLNCNWNV